MLKPIKTKAYKFLGRIPELNYILLHDNATNKIEAWTPSRGINLGAIQLQGYELEFVREIICAFRVPDNAFNRMNAPDEIGRIYVDRAPTYSAEIVELK